MGSGPAADCELRSEHVNSRVRVLLLAALTHSTEPRPYRGDPLGETGLAVLP